jgi:hypothetical protein
LIVDPSYESDAFVASRCLFDSIHVPLAVRRSTHQDQRSRLIADSIRMHSFENMILGFKSSHHEVIVTPDKSELTESIRRRVQDWRPVWDELHCLTDFCGQHFLNDSGVSDNHVSPLHGLPLSPLVVPSTRSPPLLTARLQPIHVDDGRNSGSLEQWQDGGVSGIHH